MNDAPDWIVDAILEAGNELGRQPTASEVIEHAERDAIEFLEALQESRATWTDAFRAAGHDVDNPTAETPTRDALHAEIQRVADRTGRTPTAAELVERGDFSMRAYQSTFGSVAAAVETADC